jgi:hypothetical protein
MLDRGVIIVVTPNNIELSTTGATERGKLTERLDKIKSGHRNVQR